MTTDLRLDLLDVFASDGLSGNPLAVVRGGECLGGDSMLRLTRWLGFSETAFLLPAKHEDADYAVRIFYPGGELPFAGHPTLGSARAWLTAGGIPQRPGLVVQTCGVGQVGLRVDGEHLAFAAPRLLRSGPLSAGQRAEAIELAGVDPRHVIEAVHIANGPNWRLLRLASAVAVLGARPAAEATPGTDIGLAGPSPEGGDHDWEVRAFFANDRGRLIEDLVTGSFNAGLACHLFANDMVKGESFVAAQGQKVGARGRVHAGRDGEGTIWIGGRTVVIARDARLELPR